MTNEDRTAVTLAIGRILRIASRPYQPGDIEQYERCRAIIMDLCAPVHTYVPNYARDRMIGAAGD